MAGKPVSPLNALNESKLIEPPGNTSSQDIEYIGIGLEDQNTFERNEIK